MLFTARIDRPMGTCHPKHPDLYYPVNYGEIPGVIAADGDPQDVYVLGVDEPLTAFTGEVIAVIRRRDDVEDKWVMSPEGVRFTEDSAGNLQKPALTQTDALVNLVGDKAMYDAIEAS